MPNTVPKSVTCRRCQDRPQFDTIGELRKHQWAAHPETYKKTIKAMIKSRHPLAVRKKIGEGVHRHYTARRVASVKLLGNGLLASDLLKELQGQQKFMNDVVALVSSLIAQHEANK